MNDAIKKSIIALADINPELAREVLAETEVIAGQSPVMNLVHDLDRLERAIRAGMKDPDSYTAWNDFVTYFGDVLEDIAFAVAPVDKYTSSDAMGIRVYSDTVFEPERTLLKAVKAAQKDVVHAARATDEAGLLKGLAAVCLHLSLMTSEVARPLRKLSNKLVRLARTPSLRAIKRR